MRRSAVDCERLRLVGDTPSDTETSYSSVQLLIAIASSTWNQSLRVTYAASRFLQNSPDGNPFVDSVSHCSQIRQDKNGLSDDELDPPLRTRSSRSKPGDRGSRVRKVRWVVERHGVAGEFMRFAIYAFVYACTQLRSTEWVE